MSFSVSGHKAAGPRQQVVCGAMTRGSGNSPAFVLVESLSSSVLSFQGVNKSEKRMKLTLKGGAAVDPDSGEWSEPPRAPQEIRRYLQSV